MTALTQEIPDVLRLVIYRSFRNIGSYYRKHNTGIPKVPNILIFREKRKEKRKKSLSKKNHHNKETNVGKNFNFLKKMQIIAENLWKIIIKNHFLFIYLLLFIYFSFFENENEVYFHFRAYPYF